MAKRLSNNYEDSFAEYSEKGLSLMEFWTDAIFSFCSNSGKFLGVLEDPSFENAKEIPGTENLFELPIQDIGILYEKSLAVFSNTKKVEQGSFFTPQDVADFIVENIDFPKGVWMDPCAGVGILGITLSKKVFENPMESMLSGNMLFSDIDPVALLISRFNFIKEFDKSGTGKNFSKIRDKFVLADFLSDCEIPQFDYAILNPPYLGGVKMDGFETSESKNLYAFFLEKVAKRSKGFASITPQNFMHAKSFRSLRRILLNKFENIRIYAFDIVPGYVFNGRRIGASGPSKANNTRAAITIVKKGDRSYSTTDFLRWNDKNRNELFEKANSLCLEGADFNEDVFVKIGNAHLRETFSYLESLPKLRSIVSKRQTNYPLFVGTTPKYFISATKSELNRTSVSTIYFNNETDRNDAYVMINSSVAYMYWRALDGGMMLTTETILNLPIIRKDNIGGLVEKLEESELKNRVTKLNAGKLIENVKHPISLVREANVELLGKVFDESVIYLHSNDYLKRFR